MRVAAQIENGLVKCAVERERRVEITTSNRLVASHNQLFQLFHFLVAGMRQSELDLLAQGPPGGRWVLVETPFDGIGPDFHAAFDRRYGSHTMYIQALDRRVCSDHVGELPQVTPPAIAVRDLRKSYGAHEAVKGVSFEVAPGDRVVGLDGLEALRRLLDAIPSRRRSRGEVVTPHSPREASNA